MKKTRRRHDPEFKARVALEALKGDKTLQQIAAEYSIHPVQVTDWKKLMAKNAAMIFDSKGGKNSTVDFEQERLQLHAIIGQQKVELDFLKKKSKQLAL